MTGRVSSRCVWGKCGEVNGVFFSWGCLLYTPYTPYMPKTFYNTNTHTGRQFRCRLQCGRCTARTNSGQRRRRRVCEGTDTCFQHRKRDLGVRIAPSPGRGRGVFATRRLPRGLVAVYSGELLTDAQVDARYGQGNNAERGHVPYGLKVTQRNPAHRGKTADAACSRSLASVINGSRTMRGANIRFSGNARRDGKINVYSTRAINPGEELLAYYGGDYWQYAQYNRHRTT